MIVTMIAALGVCGEIGRNNDLMWKLKGDMRHFRSYTTGKVVIMGRKTFESIGSKPLPDRLNIVVSAQEDYYPDGVVTMRSPQKALEYAEQYGVEVVVIGGQKIYEAFMPLCNKLVLTHVCQEFHDADAFFPPLDGSSWNVVSESHTHISDADNQYPFYIETLERDNG